MAPFDPSVCLFGAPVAPMALEPASAPPPSPKRARVEAPSHALPPSQWVPSQWASGSLPSLPVSASLPPSQWIPTGGALAAMLGPAPPRPPTVVGTPMVAAATSSPLSHPPIDDPRRVRFRRDPVFPLAGMMRESGGIFGTMA